MQFKVQVWKNSVMRYGAAALAIILFGAPPQQLLAAECAAPCFGYAISAELQDDWLFQSESALDEGNDLGPTIDAESAFKPVNHLKLASVITTEQVLDRSPGKDRAFEDIGTFVGQLYAEFDYDALLLRGGKFDPQFGLATHKLDGVYATDLLGDYDTDERWGVEGNLHFEALDLSHAITASAFTTDRTFLSESIFTNRGRRVLSQGGAGNAEGIASVAAFIDGCKGAEAHDCYGEGRFGYRLGIRYQKAGHQTEEQAEDDITPRDETGYLAAVTARFDLDPWTLRLLGEAAYFEHFEGNADNSWFATAATALETEPVTLLASYTRKRNVIAGEPDTTEQLFDLTAIYDFGEDNSIAGETWTLAAAYRYARNDDGESNHTIGLKLTADLEGIVGGQAAGSGE